MRLATRPMRGSRASTFYPVESEPQLSSLDSAFQLQEYIALLIRHDVHDVEKIVSLPGKDDMSEESKSNSKEVEEERRVDENCWIYEQLRCVFSAPHRHAAQTNISVAAGSPRT